MAPFVGNGTKVKIPSEIKPPLEPQSYQALGNLKTFGGAEVINGHLTLIGMRQGGFIPLIIFGLDFVS